MTSHELARKLLDGPDLKILIPSSNRTNDVQFLSKVSYGGSGIPKDYEVSEDFIELRNKIAISDPYQELVFLN